MHHVAQEKKYCIAFCLKLVSTSIFTEQSFCNDDEICGVKCSCSESKANYNFVRNVSVIKMVLQILYGQATFFDWDFISTISE